MKFKWLMLALLYCYVITIDMMSIGKMALRINEYILFIVSLCLFISQKSRVSIYPLWSSILLFLLGYLVLRGGSTSAETVFPTIWFAFCVGILSASIIRKVEVNRKKQNPTMD